MNKIRILLIDLRGDLGGGSVFLASLLKNLDQSRFAPYTAAPKDQFHSSVFRCYSQAIFELPYRHFSLRAFWKLVQFVERHQIHLIHSHGRGAGIYGRLVGKLLQLPVIHTFHGISDRQPSVKSCLDFQLERWLARATTRFIHVSESERDHALLLGISKKHRAFVISNGINAESFLRDETSRAQVRTQLGVSDHQFVVGCVARFDPCKRHEDLIEAMRLLQPKHPETQLCLIGKGEREGFLRKLVQKYHLDTAIHFLGEQTQLRAFYSAFDLFVLPSLYEGLPLTPLEAMAAGCPVILTDVRGNQDIIKHEKTGLLTPVQRPDGLAKNIERLIQDSELRSRLAKDGNLMVRARFSIIDSVHAYEEMYLDLCQFPKFRRVVLIHDWLFHMRGGEKVLEAIGEIFPSAPIFSLFIDPKKLSPSIQKHALKASWLNRLPGAYSIYRFLLPFFPFAIKQFKLKNVDLIISSSHCAAKGVQKPKGAIHICYCHTPMRYTWGFEEEYFGSYSTIFKFLIKLAIRSLKKWDLRTNETVDYFVANSKNVKARIQKFYNRDAEVIYPPIQTVNHNVGQFNSKPKNYFLMVSAFVPYKRVDIAIDAFNQLGFPLVIIGNGPLENYLKKRAQPNIKFLGWLSDEQIAKYYKNCRALIFPTEEDFGMVPLEAMMYGKPVIAYGKGGALETVIPVEKGKEVATGIFFSDQNVKSLSSVVRQFDESQFDPEVIRRHAENFKVDNFKSQFRSFVEETQG